MEVKCAFLVDPIYLKHAHDNVVVDFRNYEVPLGRRFRSLKLWFTFRQFGVIGLQQHVRKACQLAKEFELLIKQDQRFELAAPVHLGLVCFRLKGDNEATQKLLQWLHKDMRIFLIPTMLGEKFLLRLAIDPIASTSMDMVFAWKVIKEMTDKIVAHELDDSKLEYHVQSHKLIRWKSKNGEINVRELFQLVKRDRAGRRGSI